MQETIGKYRWTICGLLFFASTINYLDRAVISFLKSTLTTELHWNDGDYVNVEIAFKIAYAVGLLLSGRVIDKLGTKIGYALATGLWSLSAIAHSLATGVLGFSVARAALGVSEAGNFPAAIKTVAEWFPKRERAFATGLIEAPNTTITDVLPAGLTFNSATPPCTYTAGTRSGAWIKVRFAKHQEFVIGGFKPNATSFDSLLVGYYDGAKLRCAGKVRSGFTPHLRADVFRELEPLQVTRCPFANLPSSKSSHWGEGITSEEMKALRWVKPMRVAEISFAEWTRDGSLRHAAFHGLRDDKRARDVVKE
jgi:hypothetical protein